MYIKISYIIYILSHYGNPILSLYITSWVSFWCLQIEPLLYIFTTNLACIPVFYIDKWFIYLYWKHTLSSIIYYVFF